MASPVLIYLQAANFLGVAPKKWVAFEDSFKEMEQKLTIKLGALLVIGVTVMTVLDKLLQAPCPSGHAPDPRAHGRSLQTRFYGLAEIAERLHPCGRVHK